jgi:hypothetical protein
MHWALASSQHLLDVLIIKHGSRRAIAFSHGGEPPIVVERRKELTYLLCQAAELEHAVMCEYLYAAFSLKSTAGPVFATISLGRSRADVGDHLRSRS